MKNIIQILKKIPINLKYVWGKRGKEGSFLKKGGETP